MASIDNMKLSSSEIQMKINNLTTQMNTLQGLIAAYQQKRNEISTFAGEGDSNYEKMVANVEANIDAAKRAYTIAVQSRDSFQKALEEVSSGVTNIGTALGQSSSEAKTVFEAKLPVNELLG